MFKQIIRFFDRAEDTTRGALSHTPIIYAIFGGFAVIMFWRAVWETIDILWKSDNEFLYWFFYPPVQIVISIILLLMTGLMVSTFIGHRIILSGLKHEKKLEETTEELVKEEEITLKQIKAEILQMKRELMSK